MNDLESLSLTDAALSRGKAALAATSSSTAIRGVVFQDGLRLDQAAA